MEVQVNWLAVVLAALSTMVVGSVWYAKPVFGNLWIKLARLDEKNMASPVKAIILSVAASFVSAYVLAYATYLSNTFFGNSFLHDALMTAFWAWLGFTVARLLTHDLFENRPHKLTLITMGHEFVAIMVMALIIGLLKP